MPADAPTVEPSPPIEPGATAPAFTLKDQDGVKHALKDYRGKWVVLYFYPKDDTPGCTKQACGLRDGYADLTGRDVVVLGVSSDDEASHTRFREKFDLPFDLLADTDRKVIQKYGVWQEKNMYGRKSMGLVRTTYLIDPKGKVAHRWDRVKTATHFDAVVKKLDELQGG